MNDAMRRLGKAIVAGLVIGFIVEGLFTLASVVTRVLRFPSELNLQPVSGIAGGVLLAAGLGLVLWLFRYRSPLAMIVSTYYTFVKMFTGGLSQNSKADQNRWWWLVLRDTSDICSTWGQLSFFLAGRF